MEEWAVATHSLSILLTASWLVVFLSNLVSLTLTLTLLILMGIELSTEIAMLLLTAMLPYYVGSTFTPILYIGKRLTLKDEDFRAVFPSWMSNSASRRHTVHPLPVQEESGAIEADLLEALEDDVDSVDDNYLAARISEFVYSEQDDSDFEDQSIRISIENTNSLEFTE